ncbi:hypothetical protein JCM10212_002522 [Sporobolomyces blumeae]
MSSSTSKAISSRPSVEVLARSAYTLSLPTSLHAGETVALKPTRLRIEVVEWDEQFRSGAYSTSSRSDALRAPEQVQPGLGSDQSVGKVTGSDQSVGKAAGVTGQDGAKKRRSTSFSGDADGATKRARRDDEPQLSPAPPRPSLPDSTVDLAPQTSVPSSPLPPVPPVSAAFDAAQEPPSRKLGTLGPAKSTADFADAVKHSTAVADKVRSLAELSKCSLVDEAMKPKNLPFPFRPSPVPYRGDNLLSPAEIAARSPKKIFVCAVRFSKLPTGVSAEIVNPFLERMYDVLHSHVLNQGDDPSSCLLLTQLAFTQAHSHISEWHRFPLETIVPFEFSSAHVLALADHVHNWLVISPTGLGCWPSELFHASGVAPSPRVSLAFLLRYKDDAPAAKTSVISTTLGRLSSAVEHVGFVGPDEPGRPVAAVEIANHDGLSKDEVSLAQELVASSHARDAMRRATSSGVGLAKGKEKTLTKGRIRDALGMTLPTATTRTSKLTKIFNGLLGRVVEKEFECDICRRTLISPRDLRAHRSRHGKKKRHACTFDGCRKAFTSRSSLTIHFRSHTGERPFACSFDGCRKAFTTRQHLTVHHRSHTGEKPYACTFDGCGQAFAAGANLTAHRRLHTGEKPYLCTVDGCDKAFSTSNDLTVHRRRHTGEKPYLCKVDGCDKAFGTSSELTVHRRRHSGEKPYPCTVDGCDKAFATSSDHTVHLRSHSGEKPYPCTVDGCDKAFSTSGGLKTHKLWTHTSARPR